MPDAKPLTREELKAILVGEPLTRDERDVLQSIPGEVRPWVRQSLARYEATVRAMEARIEALRAGLEEARRFLDDARTWTDAEAKALIDDARATITYALESQASGDYSTPEREVEDA